MSEEEKEYELTKDAKILLHRYAEVNMDTLKSFRKSLKLKERLDESQYEAILKLHSALNDVCYEMYKVFT